MMVCTSSVYLWLQLPKDSDGLDDVASSSRERGKTMACLGQVAPCRGKMPGEPPTLACPPGQSSPNLLALKYSGGPARDLNFRGVFQF